MNGRPSRYSTSNNVGVTKANEYKGEQGSTGASKLVGLHEDGSRGTRHAPLSKADGKPM